MKKALIIIAVIGAFIFIVNLGGGSSPSRTSTYDYSYSDYEEEEENQISRDEAIDYYWDEVKDYMDGYDEVEVFSYESANYYYLEAEISGGVVETIYFPNGGYLYIDAEIDSDGSGSGFDYESANYWDVEFDMDSSLVDDAIADWAWENEYEIY